MSSTTSTASATASSTSIADSGSGTAQESAGISIVAFFTALASSLVIFGVQTGLFLLLRNKLARIYKPKTYLVPERERTDPPPVSPWGLVHALLRLKDREIIKKCGLDAYFFLRYLQTLLLIFIPIAVIVIPILVPVNYVGGLSQNFSNSSTDTTSASNVTGLDTLAWGNVRPAHSNRYWAHLVLAVFVVVWVCYVFFWEMRTYIKIRQDYLTSAEHRMRASANTVLVSGIPNKWVSEEALRGLFDVFPGGIRNIWLTRDYTELLDKIHQRDDVHKQLEAAESQLIRNAKKNQMKKQAADDKKARKRHKAAALTKAEREKRQQDEDERARRMAEGTGGISSGNQEVPQIDGTNGVDGGDDDSRSSSSSDGNDNDTTAPGQKGPRVGLKKVTILGSGLSKVGQGIKGGAATAGKKAGSGLVGGAKSLQRGVDNQIERSGGFEFVRSDDGSTGSSSNEPGPSSRPVTRDSERQRRPGVRIVEGGRPGSNQGSQGGHGAHYPRPSDASSLLSHSADQGAHSNTTRKVTNWDAVVATEDRTWWQFWKPPSGAYASPIPQGYEDGDEFPFGSGGGKKGGSKDGDKKDKTLWQQVQSSIPFFGGGGGDDDESVAYPSELNPSYPGDKEEEEGAEWTRWLKEKERPTHRLPLFSWTPKWLPGLPLLHKKADSIHHYRRQLARLNMEIEEDQQNHERYPIMNSAFIQFNNQVAAHMACQSVTHHVPKQMSPRIVEVSPNDVIWDNMAIRWWDSWLRTLIVVAVVFGMTVLWAFPVAFTSSLAQIDSLVSTYPWLGFIQRNQATYNVAKAVAGVLPALLLALLLFLVPIILDLLATFQGAKTGSEKAEYVQIYYFFFLFVQVFLVVSIASGTITTLQDTVSNVQNVPQILAQNLPKAANYFFSYMILQALSTSSGTLLQVGVLAVWYLLARILDDTARSKWARQTGLPSISWGPFFPVYTNFACIALVYSVIAPIISIFAIITFALLWAAHRYNMIYVTRFKIDTGGVLYPRAINQTFTGLYFMQLCLIGLFFLVRNENNEVTCAPQAIIMIVVLALTVMYQVLLNWSFGPLLRYLPITFEDEAVLRDEAFQRAQARRLGLLSGAAGSSGGGNDDDDDLDMDDEATTLTGTDSRASRNAHASAGGNVVELKTMSERGRESSFPLTAAAAGGRLNNLNPVRGIVRGGQRVRAATFGKAEQSMQTAASYRQRRRQRDLEAQRAIGEALYGGYHDEIEDLTPEERDVLVREAFKHSALRARRPTVWIPRDDIGVSDDEIRHTCNLSEYIWISNEGTALDSKARVVYGRAPPDFSDIDLIDL